MEPTSRITHHTTPRGPRRAFTLIEILVVVAIIVILVGAVIAVGGYIRQKAQRDTTRVVLQNLNLILAEYKELNGGNIPTLGPDFAKDFNNTPSLKKQLAKLPSACVTPTTIMDGFGNPIYFVSPTNPNSSYGGYPREGFQSAGPNGKYGQPSPSKPQDAQDAADDIFSWDP